MFKSGWMRLWLVASAFALIVVLSWASYYVWGEQACRRMVTVSVSSKAVQEKQELANRVKSELVEQPLCGPNINSNLLTLGSLASEGVVTQVSLEWLEPDGWTFGTKAMIDILNGKEITPERIIANSTRYVRQARLKTVWPVVPFLFALISAALLIGFAVNWVRGGFGKSCS